MAAHQERSRPGMEVAEVWLGSMTAHATTSLPNKQGRTSGGVSPTRTARAETGSPGRRAAATALPARANPATIVLTAISERRQLLEAVVDYRRDVGRGVSGEVHAVDLLYELAKLCAERVLARDHRPHRGTDI